MTDTMREAAQEASIADGVLTATHHNLTINEQNKLKQKTDLRRGKWTIEEEAYANRLIEEFKAGMLPIADGTTLRTFLSKLLNCDPMRISKKYVGNNCIGKQVYRQRHGDIDDIPPEKIERSRRELEELERQFIERSKQSNGRTRPNKTDSGQKPPRVKKEIDPNGHHQYKSNVNNNNNSNNNNNNNNNSNNNNNQIAPWIIPSNNYSSYGSESNPYSTSNGNMNRNSNNNNNSHNNNDINEYKTGLNNSNYYGMSERAISDIDLVNLPDAFASTSSLDLLGTIAEMKLPSARSLENLQKFGMEGNGASTASLSEWYSILGENASLSTSMIDLPSQNASTTSLSSSFSNSMDWSANPIMPWDTKKIDNVNNEHYIVNNNNNNNNINNNNNNISNTNDSPPKNPNLKHSLSKELLQAAAAAVAHDEAKQEIAKILKQQYNDKLKEFTLNNNLNTSLNTNITTPTSRPPVTSIVSPCDARRSASVNNFMMLVELGDIPKPDPSILLKNIFSDSSATTSATATSGATNNNSNSTTKQINQSNSVFPISSNKRSLDSNQQQQQSQQDNLSDSMDGSKKRRFSNSSDSEDNNNIQKKINVNNININGDGDGDDDISDDDCLGDEHIISATVVRRPFT
eukprot:CAMPEP_0174819028 /NCGR_PEP_ID=MMETSP1107-20130205/2013_1 /TAXON_ID=36770 /ORGANISM="Paraphysomonas vestita, Strain GFlagA" /LENGTH=631 /DNA_ID=CAMNT_0016031781 /DNA_START=119 /DNA_END=2014 /DNA_ORIENTATION=-